MNLTSVQIECYIEEHSANVLSHYIICSYCNLADIWNIRSRLYRTLNSPQSIPRIQYVPGLKHWLALIILSGTFDTKVILSSLSL